MKSCPTCHRVYEDETMSFCLEDGTPLVRAAASSPDPSATIKIPAARLTNQAPTEILGEEAVPPTQPALAVTRQPDTPLPVTPSERKQNPLPWILGAALILGLSAIGVAWIVTRSSSESNGSQVAQKTVQLESTQEAGNTASFNKNANQIITSTPTPASDTSSRTQANKTPEQPSSTPKQTPAVSKASPPASEEPPPAPKPTPVTAPKAPISGGVLNGKAISLPKPAYPPIAKAAHASGTVTVQVTIDESGRVISAHAVSGHPLLQQSAVQAAYEARFSPTMVSGQPVKVTGLLTYNFVAQ